MSRGDPMHFADPMRSDPGRWCPEHRRWECTKAAKGGGLCHGWRIVGLDRCRMHAGEKGATAKAKGEAVTAWSALAGQPTVTATEAVLGMLQMSWLRVHLYAGLLEEQVSDAQGGRGAGGGSGPSGGVGSGEGLIGHTISGLKDYGLYASGEAVRGLAQLEAAERDRCVRFAKTAHDMGIAEQQIRLAEGQGQLLAEVIRRILGALELTAEQQGLVATVVPRELRAIAGGAA